MSATEQTKTEEINQTETMADHGSSVNMESMNRIAKLPVVESTINAATSLYEKAKDSNSMINWTLTTAESTVKTGVEKITPLAQPVTSRLEGPIRKVDEMLCTGLDYVENKVPCVKLPPSEMLANTKNYINDTVTPAVQTASILVQPAVQGAVAVKDYGVERVEELLKGKKQDKTADENCEKPAK
ncbi:Lipid storage droplet-1 [Carabus blaptoides fortunei]